MALDHPPSYHSSIPGTVVYTGEPPGQYVIESQPPEPPINYSQLMTYDHQTIRQIPVQWMERPNIPGCSSGLEYLTKIDQLLIRRTNPFRDDGEGHKYHIKNTLGQIIYFALEDVNISDLVWCGANRTFKFHIYDNVDHEIIEITRQNRYNRKCCVRDLVTVESPPGTIVGYVKQKHYNRVVHYKVTDAKETEVLRIVGPHYCHCFCPGDDIPFKVMSADQIFEIGRVSTHSTGSRHTNFGIQFPIDLDVKIKAVLIGAIILIDFNYLGRNLGGPHYILNV